MAQSKTKCLLAVGVLLAAVGQAHSAPPGLFVDRFGNYVADDGNVSSAAGGIEAWNDDYMTMCMSTGPDVLQGPTRDGGPATGNAAEPNWVIPLCPGYGDEIAPPT